MNNASEKLSTEALWRRLEAMPTFFYELPGTHEILYVHLGGDSVKIEDYSRDYVTSTLRWELEKIFRAEDFSPNSVYYIKEAAGRTRLLAARTNARSAGLYTADEQRAFIEKLSERARQELLWQIEFYEACLKCVELADRDEKSRSEFVAKRKEREKLLGGKETIW